TTRPELLPACIGISVHPDDQKYKDLIGKYVKMPLTGAKIQITPDEETDMNYGTGVVYYCSYGGMECIEWMSRHTDVEPINVMDVNGIYNSKAGKYEGLNSIKARTQIIEDLKKDGCLVKQEPIKHIVNTHERCGTDIEFVATEQWFIEYLDLKDRLLEAGAKLNWNPSHMRNRLDNWIKGLKWDWCLSRQKKFGVPIPVWYCKKCSEVIIADKKQLPIDPLEDKPLLKKCQKCGCNEFLPEKDVLDTWATSSMTPQIAAKLVPERYNDIYPMDLRPQAHDIISFWLFNTMVKSQLHNNINPWKDVMISGWALDPKGKKMSKSKGNVIEPQKMIENYSADAIRYWAAKSKLGDDVSFKEEDLRTGMKLCIKLWNASKFCISHLTECKQDEIKTDNIYEILDIWMMEKTNQQIEKATNYLDNYQYSAAKKEIEFLFFNTFCDNYLEFIKYRIYNEELTKSKKSALATLNSVIFDVLTMFAPFIPFITEEIYQLSFKQIKKEKSIHLCSWPKSKPTGDKQCLRTGDLFCEIIAQIRQYKNKNNLSLKTQIKQIKIFLKTKEEKELIEKIIEDIKGVGIVEKISLYVNEQQEENIFVTF
ncbi:MAG: class I tRNA ligase family protein, partial [Candidatus Aenigmarchaeota archaeon]|nr:class I tRNA ligase family protein [Candidatus Aenigmarchaeota archaeon]